MTILGKRLIGLVVVWTLVVMPALAYRQRVVKKMIVSGQIIVKPGQTRWFAVIVPNSSENAHIAGSFRASGGGGNDIHAVIVEGQVNLENWANGHQAMVLWDSGGLATAGKFDVEVGPGLYYLVFSNRHSLVSMKEVSVSSGLVYVQEELQ